LQHWFSFISYLKYLFRAKGPDSLHSPFVYRFYCEVLQNPYQFYALEALDACRARLLSSREPIRYRSMGAKTGEREARVGDLARRSLLPPEKMVFLFQLAYWLKPATVLELGTFMGISTASLAKAHSARVITFEGVPEFAAIARKVWQELEITGIQLLQGDIDETLPSFSGQENLHAELIFVDANHTREATLRYFQMLKKMASPQACMVFDDIYWSEGMAAAWTEIKADPAVTVSIDLFHFGLVFFRKESPKENFVIRW
jgi:predicted O-methyltransferase YrrM